MIPNLIRRLLVTAVVVPLAAAGARKVSDMVEARRGPNRGTRLLRQGAQFLQGNLGRQRRHRRFHFGR